MRLRGCPGLVENPGDEDGNDVKDDHRRRKKHHVRNVGRRGQHRGRDHDDDQRGLPDLDQEFGGNDADSRQNVRDRRHLKHHAHAQHHQDDEVEIV